MDLTIMLIISIFYPGVAGIKSKSLHLQWWAPGQQHPEIIQAPNSTSRCNREERIYEDTGIGESEKGLKGTYRFQK
jgi:hypothetical protein